MKETYSIHFVLLGVALFCCLVVCDGLNNGSSRGLGRPSYKSESQKSVYNGLSFANGDYQMRQVSAAAPRESSKPRQGIGLSAWGIIGVIAGSLLLGTVLYYTLLFYPILCKKERKNSNDRSLNCCPTAPPAMDMCPALSTPV